MSEILKELNGILNINIPEDIVEEVIKVERDHFTIEVNVKNAQKMMKILCEEAGIYHLSTITGMEKEKEFIVIYHLQHRIEEEFREVPINLVIKGIDKKNPKSPSMVEFFVAADYYEREIYDFYGIYFENHPFLQRLILPERWPDDVRPLRKEYTWQQVRDITMKIVKQGLEEEN
ncbi:MAG: NADH-quinone oxidoreductase subunit C [Candidatus Heimdallarchaeaceae archaeon]